MLGSIGNTQSTFLGCGEISDAARLMDAHVSLIFEPDSVVFSLAFALQVTEKKSTPANIPPMPPGSAVLFADDDAVVRIIDGKVAQRLQVANRIVGETYEGASALVSIVLQF